MRSWKSVLSRDPENPSRGVDVCENLICLASSLHDTWNKGYFGLRQVLQSPDKRELVVEFHWLPKVSRGPKDLISLSTPWPST